MIKVIVVDDEPLARDGIASLLADDGEVEVAAVCGDGETAVAEIRRHSPDLLLLDVEMPGMSGLDVVKSLAVDSLPVIIFITAFDQYAIKAFEAHAVEYLLKPFSDERFSLAMDRAKTTLRDRQLARLSENLLRLVDELAPSRAPAAAQHDRFAQRITVKSGMRSYFIPVSDIDWIEGADYCAKIHSGGRGHIIRESLGSLIDRLDPSGFFRVHPDCETVSSEMTKAAVSVKAHPN